MKPRVTRSKDIGIQIYLVGNQPMKILWQYKFSRFYYFIEWWRHLFEELHFIPKQYPTGEPYYTGWSTRMHFLFRALQGNSYARRHGFHWFLTGEEAK